MTTSDSTTPKPRGGIYVRLSREADKSKTGDQLAVCRKLADDNDIDVVEVYEDNGISAFTGKNRPGWTQLLQDVSDGKVDVLLAQSEDRFTRQVGEKETLTILCARVGVTWLTRNDGPVDPRTADGEFFSILRGGLARMESRRKSERTAQRNHERRLRGDSPRGGVRPFGYGVPRNGDWDSPSMRTIRRLIPGTGKKTGVPADYEPVEVIDWDTDKLHPVEAPLVGAAYHYVLETENGMGMGTVATTLNHFGVTTVNGKPWDLPKIEKVLRRGRNAGFVEHRAFDPASGKMAVWASQVLDADGQPVRGAWETIVDEATYEAVMARLTNPDRAIKRPRESTHLMSSLARCVCGLRLRVAGRNRGEVAYRCGIHDGADHKRDDVKHVSIRCEELDRISASAVVTALIHTPRLAVPDPDAERLYRLHIELNQISQSRKALLDLVEDPDFDPAQVKAKNLDLRTRAESARAEIRVIAEGNARAELLAHVTTRLAADTATDAFGDPVTGSRVSIGQGAQLHHELLARFYQLPLAQRRALVRALIQVTVLHGRGPDRVHVRHLVATGLNEDE